MLTAKFKTRAARGFAILSILFVCVLIPIERIAARESDLVRSATGNCWSHLSDHLFQHPRSKETGISAREQLRRRGSF